MLGPYLEEGEGSGALPASSDERSYLLGAERAKPCVIGMKPKAEYWVEIIPAELESVSLDMIVRLHLYCLVTPVTAVPLPSPNLSCGG